MWAKALEPTGITLGDKRGAAPLDAIRIGQTGKTIQLLVWFFEDPSWAI
jgi:hypothetical protein